jgi:ABC-type transporter Mla subunit MlaD
MASATQNAKDLLGNLADKARDTEGQVADKVKDFASQTADRAKDFGKSATNMANTATARVGSGVESMADKLRDSAPREGVVHDAASKVADTLERSGRYLQEEGLAGMADDLTNVIKRNPIPAVLVGIGVGYLIAHALRR